MSEIERKFLVGQRPEDLGSGSEIHQAYIALDDEVEVRVRRRDSQHTLTIKGGAGIERVEIEIGIDEATFDVLWTLARGRTITKHRYELAVGEHTAELDEYSDALEGLWIVEVEFDDRSIAEQFDPPNWFGDEVTDADRWSNAQLAQSHRPPS